MIFLYIPIVMFIDHGQVDRGFWTECLQALPEFNLVLICLMNKISDLLLSFPNTLSMSPCQVICFILSCLNFDLHSGNGTATCT
jgi:hypothetical protein